MGNETWMSEENEMSLQPVVIGITSTHGGLKEDQALQWVVNYSQLGSGA